MFLFHGSFNTFYVSTTIIREMLLMYDYNTYVQNRPRVSLRDRTVKDLVLKNQLWRLWKSQLKKISSRNSSKSDVSWLIALAKAKKHDSDLLDQQTVLSEAKVKREKS